MINIGEDAPNKSTGVSEELAPVLPQVKTIDYSSDIVDISDRKLRAVYNNCYISITRGKKYRVGVVCNVDGELKHTLAVDDITAIDLSSLNIEPGLVERLNFYIVSWDSILDRREAELYLRARLKVSPKSISDREIMAEMIAKEMLKMRTIRTFMIREGSREIELGVYCYDNGYYRVCEEELRALAESLTREYPAQEFKMTTWVVEEALNKIRRRTQTPWSPAKHVLLFKDKLFSWEKFVEHGVIESSLMDPSPDLNVEHKIPWQLNMEVWSRHRQNLEKYVPPRCVDDIINIFKISAPKSYQAFLSWVKREEESEDDARGRVALLLEIIGYTLFPHSYPFHKAILLVGDGSNGKSTYLALIRTILGDWNIASVPLSDLDPRINRFAIADLYGKLANLSSEPVKGLRIDLTRFKQLTGEDPVRFERKFKDGFTSYNYAKMIFSANELPEVNEDTYAVWRRWIVLEFPNRFKPDPEFFNKTFMDEIDAIIVLSLHAFRLTLLRKGFTELGTKDPKEAWMSRSNPVYRVLKKMFEMGLVEIDKDGWIIKEDLYNLYKAVLSMINAEEDEDLLAVSKKKFTEEIEKLYPVRRGETHYSGKHVKTYVGIRIKNWDLANQLVPDLETPNLGWLSK
ncbi:MAG: phage/plasmid primase, P4 family [Thermosphaera sp.]